MAIEILGSSQQQKMRTSGRIAADVLARVTERVRPGVSSLDVDRWVREEATRLGARSSVLGYQGYPASVCVSRNECVCHGIPSAEEIFVDGDIVNVDVTLERDGYHGDTSKMVLVGSVSPEANQIVEVASRARAAGISAVRPGARLGDVAAAVMAVAEEARVGLVRQLGGHGIGREMHQDPHVSYVGKAGTGLRLKTGMCITIEPMVNAGSPDVVFGDDGWRVSTHDGSLSAQFEHTVLVTETGAEVLTEF